MCGRTSWHWQDVQNRYCSHCQIWLETPLQRAWRRYRERDEYEPRAFPFSPRRMTLFGKLNRDFVVLVTLAGLAWIGVKLFMFLVG